MSGSRPAAPAFEYAEVTAPPYRDVLTDAAIVSVSRETDTDVAVVLPAVQASLDASFVLTVLLERLSAVVDEVESQRRGLVSLVNRTLVVLSVFGGGGNASRVDSLTAGGVAEEVAEAALVQGLVVSNVRVESVDVPNGQALGDFPVLASTTDDAIFRPAASGEEVVMEGRCQGVTDLLAMPVVYYWNTTWDVSLDQVLLMENLTLIFTSGALNYSGVVDPDTGVPENWDEEALNATAPVFSEVGWFNYNCQREEPFLVEWYVHLFHDFPRVNGATNFFVYPQSSDFETFTFGVAFTALPFIVIAVAICVASPVLYLLRPFCRPFRCLCRPCRSHRPAKPHPLVSGMSSASMGRRRRWFNHSGFSSDEEDEEDGGGGGIGRDQRIRCTAICRQMRSLGSSLGHCFSGSRCRSRESTEPASGTLSSEGGVELSTVTRPTLASLNSGATGEKRLQATESSLGGGFMSRRKRSQALRLRNSIVLQRNKLDKLLVPSTGAIRIMILGLLFLALVEVPLGFTAIVVTDKAATKFETGAKVIQSQMSQANALANASGNIVQGVLQECGSQIPGDVETALQNELGLLERYEAIVDPALVEAISGQLFSEVDFWRALVWVILQMVIVLVLTSSVWSMCLTYCRFTWGKERVVCTRISYQLGRCVQPLLVVASCLSWAVLGVLCALITITADWCIEPNMIVVNTTVATQDDSAAVQAEALIYNFRETSATSGLAVDLNIGGFLADCRFTNVLFNPYSYLAVQANIVHHNARAALLETSCGSSGSADNGTFVGQYVASGFYADLQPAMQCTALQDMSTGIDDFCVSLALPWMFTYFCSLIVYNVLILVIVQNHREMQPNLYRMSVANDYHRAISDKQERLKLVLGSAGSVTVSAKR